MGIKENIKGFIVEKKHDWDEEAKEKRLLEQIRKANFKKTYQENRRKMAAEIGLSEGKQKAKEFYAKPQGFNFGNFGFNMNMPSKKKIHGYAKTGMDFSKTVLGNDFYNAPKRSKQIKKTRIYSW